MGKAWPNRVVKEILHYPPRPASPTALVLSKAKVAVVTWSAEVASTIPQAAEPAGEGVVDLEASAGR